MGGLWTIFIFTHTTFTRKHKSIGLNKIHSTKQKEKKTYELPQAELLTASGASGCAFQNSHGDQPWLYPGVSGVDRSL
jgi:hypothetical protein